VCSNVLPLAVALERVQQALATLAQNGKGQQKTVT